MVELSHHYASLSETPFEGVTVNLAATGAFGTSYTVPGNDVRLLRFVTMRMSSGVGSFVGRVACVLRRNGSRCYVPFNVQQWGGPIVLSASGEAVETHYAPPVPWLLRPGDAFEVEASNVTAGSAGVTIYGLAAPLTT